MRVKEFFTDSDRFLNRGDILVSRSPSPVSVLIRILSGSFFSHAAMVFLLPKEKDGFSKTFVIQSLFMGVGVADLEGYVQGRAPIEEVGILRLESEGFYQPFFKRANGFLLNEVNKPYDFHRLFRIALSVLFGIHQVTRRVGRRPSVYRRWMPRQFICSGFIQYGLFAAAEMENIPVARVVLKNGLTDPSKDELLGITPEDLATSNKLKWKYVIRRGWVYEVDNYEEAKRLISGGRS
ncbi:YiiX/YebB-like N1pC/P60 family cysteine hydrolase [Aestuariivirga litoralis]|uniref:YiiX/YebB-like N1pC/P60 family cysteine hydrolase n=1 Tax=Aestuariivirga litoralis TaxID=2650924 RepID=UPI0018C71A39|nr:YiiX/YebB-like N1pC/P60 family cysteine hydrolase [Aestuariivirga litoralis]